MVSLKHIGPPVPMTMEMKRIVLKIRILSCIKSGKIYPYALIKQFEGQGFGAFFGPTLKNDTYNALRMLEKAGYIHMASKLEDGKEKNYYTITKEGKAAMLQLRRIMGSTLKEVGRLLK